MQQNERGQDQRVAPSGRHGLKVSAKNDWSAKQGYQRGCVHEVDWQDLLRTQTHSVGDMLRLIQHVQDRNSNQVNGVRGFKRKWWHDTNTQRNDDATPVSKKKNQIKDKSLLHKKV